MQRCAVLANTRAEARASLRSTTAIIGIVGSFGSLEWTDRTRTKTEPWRI
jgi:hypothetical protein